MYLLHEHGADPGPDSAWLLAQPSRMLSARCAIVDLTGRDQELAELAGWRDARESRLAARWLHAPGGQGKTRLSIELARHSAGENWKVIAAVQGAGSVPPSADAWPAVRASLGTHQADCSDQVLAPLPDEPITRQRMFTVARDAFAGHYRIPDPSAIQQPGTLGGADFGLILAVHVAALAAQQDALRDVRQLAAADAVMHAPNLARTLCVLASFLRQAGRYSEALSPAEEAVGMFQQLAGGLLPDAASSPEEAVEFFQRLTGNSPSLYEEDLAIALEVLADCSRHAREPRAAVAVAGKSVRTLRRAGRG